MRLLLAAAAAMLLVPAASGGGAVGEKTIGLRADFEEMSGRSCLFG